MDTVSLASPPCLVGIVDDHTMMREGMRAFVDSLEGFRCLWLADSARAAMGLLESGVPNLMIVDLTLPDRSGLELIKDVLAVYPELPMLVISMHDEEMYAQRVLKAGARGYLMKNAPHGVMEAALRRVAAGGMAVSQAISERVLMAFSTGARAPAAQGLHTLSDREFEIFQLIGQGHSTQKIAADLSISPKTVDVHRMNMRAKLNLEDGAAVTRWAIRWTEARKHGSTAELG